MSSPLPLLQSAASVPAVFLSFFRRFFLLLNISREGITDITVEDIQDAAENNMRWKLIGSLKKTENVLLAETEKHLKVRLDDAIDSLSALNQSCLAFKTLPDYKELAALPQEDVEAQMLESFLELWIYHINPARGDLPAAQKGGI